MALADFAMYVVLLSAIGPVGLAVTTNLNINFLRKPAQRDLIAEARLIKLAARTDLFPPADFPAPPATSEVAKIMPAVISCLSVSQAPNPRMPI